MPILKFKVALEEDNSIYREIEISQKTSFLDFNNCILKSFDFDNKYTGIFYSSNSNWHKLKSVSTEIFENGLESEPLSAKKTSVLALVKSPDQKFVYEYITPKKKWDFEIEMISIRKEKDNDDLMLKVVLTEGLSPSQYGPIGLKSNEFLNDIEDEYNASEDLDTDGFEVIDGNDL